MNKLKLLITVLIAFQSCNKQNSEETLVAVVGDDSLRGTINQQDFLYSFELTPSPNASLRGIEAKKDHLDKLVDRKVMALEGLKRGLDNDDQVQIPLRWYKEKAIRQALYREVIKGQTRVAEPELREAYVRSKTRIRIRHLPAKTREGALKLKEKLEQGATFSDLAKHTFRDSVLANNGGDLGYFSFGDMDESLEQAAFSLRVGEISAPIKSKWAYHIIKVEDRQTQALLTETEYQQMKPRLERIVRRRTETALADDYVRTFMNPRRVRVYGPSVVFLAQKSTELLREQDALLPLEPPKPKDSEIGKLEQIIQEHGDDVLVQFEGGQWTIRDFLAKLRQTHPDARPVMTSRSNLKDVAARMVRDEFLLQEGVRRGLESNEYVQKEVRRWREELVAARMQQLLLDTVSVSEPELFDFFGRNKSHYVEPPKANIREIFVKDKALAERLLERLAAGEDFARLAQKYSERKWAAKKGGEFGFFSVGMHGKIGQKALSMNKGELAGPLEIEDKTYGHGFSIILVLDKHARRFKTFQEVRRIVLQDALAAKQSKTLKRFLSRLREAYEIKVNDELLAKIQTTDDLAMGRKVEMFAIPRF